MNNENRRNSNGENFSSSNILGRPPPGLERNLGFYQLSLNPGVTTSPPPGLGPPFAFPIHTPGNNVFFPPQSAVPAASGYPFYSPPQTPSYNLYDSNNSFQGTSDILGGNNGNHYTFPQHSPSPNFYSGTMPRHTTSSIDPNSNRNDSSEPVRDTTSAVIEPMIENLVGSMGISNGTYSHFGPLTNSAMVSFGQGNNHENSNFVVQKSSSPIMSAGIELNHPISIDPFISPPEWEFQRKMEAKIRQKQLIQQHHYGEINANSTDSTAWNSEIGHQSLTVENKLKPHIQKPQPVYSNLAPKSLDSTPCPQTTGKPSYLEILTKNCPKSTTNAKKFGQQSFLNESTKMNGDGCPLFQVQNQPHRTSFDGILGSSSPTTSNPSTASSSPITKPRAQQKGKENIGNSSSSSSKSSTRRNTPVMTPVHQTHAEPTQSSEGDKKSQSGSTCWIKKLSGKVTNSTKIRGKLVGNGNEEAQFEFEVEDTDEREGGVDDDFQKSTGTGNGDDKTFVFGSKRKEKRKFSGVGTLVTEFGFNNNNSNGSDRRASGSESKFSNGNTTSSNSIYGLTFGQRKGNPGKEKSEKLRTRKEERNCAIRKLRVTSKQWIVHLMKAVNWLWTLLVNVTVLSLSLGYTLMEDLLTWWKVSALPTFQFKMILTKQKVNSAWKRLMNSTKRKKNQPSPKPESYDELLSVLGPERNIVLPGTGDEALRRLLSVRGQDPYNILGVRSDSSEETIRRYYKKQAVLVHPDKNLVPGAEEAFKILAKAFEMVGEPGSRLNYHQQLLEAHAKERFIGEFGELFEELRKKMETACSTIRCTKCKVRHKKNKTSRPLFAARYCAQCRIHHGAREGELWAEKGGMFSFSWQFYACMGNQIWEINEWGRCQRSSLKHLKPNAHSVIYRLVSGGQESGKNRNSSSGGNSNCTNSNGSTGAQDEDDGFDPEMDDWDSLINNLYRNSGTSNSTSSSQNTHKVSSKPSNANGSVQNGNGVNTSSTTKKRKWKRK